MNSPEEFCDQRLSGLEPRTLHILRRHSNQLRYRDRPLAAPQSPGNLLHNSLTEPLPPKHVDCESPAAAHTEQSSVARVISYINLSKNIVMDLLEAGD